MRISAAMRAHELLQGLRVAFLQLETARGEGETAQADSGGVENCIADCGSESDDGSFAGSGWRSIFSVDKYCFDLRNVAEAWLAILRKMGIADAAIFKFDGLK